MTTSFQLTPALKKELQAALKDETIQFPYECSDDALAFIAEEADGWLKMRAGQEQTIRNQGRPPVVIRRQQSQLTEEELKNLRNQKPSTSDS